MFPKRDLIEMSSLFQAISRISKLEVGKNL